MKSDPPAQPFLSPVFTNARWGDFLQALPPGQTRWGSAPMAILNEGKSRAKQWKAWRKPGRASRRERVHGREGWGGLLSLRTEAGRRCVFSKGLALLPSLLHQKAEFEVFRPIYFCM